MKKAWSVGNLVRVGIESALLLGLFLYFVVYMPFKHEWDERHTPEELEYQRLSPEAKARLDKWVDRRLLQEKAKHPAPWNYDPWISYRN